MKKFLNATLIIMLSLGFLIGCSNDSDQGDIEIRDQINLTLWLDNDDYSEALIEAIAGVFPDINLSYENVGATDAFGKLTLDGPAGIGGDIMLFTHRAANTAMNDNLLLPLGDSMGQMVKDRILDSAIGAVIKDGDYFGVPVATESIALFYNETSLDEYGFNVATSFEEIMEQAEVYNNESTNDFIFRFEAGDAYVSHFFLTAHGYQLFGPNHDDAALINLDSPEVVAGLEYYKSMRKILPVPIGDLDRSSVEGAFANGEVPYILTGPWSLAEIEERADFDWGVVKLPTIDGTQPITFSVNIVAGISAYTDHPEAARAVLDFIVSDAGLQLMYDIRGSIPALKDASVIDGLADDSNKLAILSQAEYSFRNPTIPEMPAFWEIAPTMHEAVWEGLLTTEEAAKKAQEDFDSVVAMLEQ